MEPVSAGLAIAGAATKVVGGIMQGNAEADAANTNAALLNDMAAEREKKAAFDAETRMKKAAFDIETSKRAAGRQAGTVRAKVATSGFSQESFSEVLADDAAEAALEQSAIRYTAELDAYEARYQGQQEAKQLRAQAAGQITAGQDAKRASYINGVASATASLGSVFQTKASSSSSEWDTSLSYG